MSIPFEITSLKTADIPQAQAIERAAYITSPPNRDFLKELSNQLAHYFVLHAISKAPTPGTLKSMIGVAGFWLIADEIHVITIAVHPQWKRQGGGELMLIKLLEEGYSLGAAVATLEARPSNQSALSLYQKYKFQQVGNRPGYYDDNGEDALILTTPLLTSLEYQRMLTEQKAQLVRRMAKNAHV